MKRILPIAFQRIIVNGTSVCAEAVIAKVPPNLRLAHSASKLPGIVELYFRKSVVSDNSSRADVSCYRQRKLSESQHNAMGDRS
jgi:hypothetical protein